MPSQQFQWISCDRECLRFVHLLLDPSGLSLWLIGSARKRLSIATAKKAQSPLLQVPAEIKNTIFTFLSAKDSIRLSKTCRVMRASFAIRKMDISIHRNQHSVIPFLAKKWLNKLGLLRFISLPLTRNVCFLIKRDGRDLWDLHQRDFLSFEGVPLSKYKMYQLGKKHLEVIDTEWVQLKGPPSSPFLAPLVVVGCAEQTQMPVRNPLVKQLKQWK